MIVRVPHPDNDGKEHHLDVLRAQEKVPNDVTKFTMPNHITSVKYALESALGLADVGAPRPHHGDGDSTINPPQRSG